MVIFLMFSQFLNAEDIYFKDNKWDMKKLKEIYLQDSSKWPKPTIDEGIEYKELESIQEVDKKLLEKPIVKLGQRLFHEPRLSKDNSISCATCHVPNNHFIQRTEFSSGFNGLRGNRNTPTLYGLKDLDHLFWDGRASSLEEQALGPIMNPVEMALSKEELEAKLKILTGYKKEVKDAFNSEELTSKRVAKALAEYERTIEPPRTKFDRFLEGDEKAYNDYEVLGLHLFRTKARCMNCHSGKYLTDGKFHNLGLTYYGREKEDLGRYNVTLKNEDVGKFKTPTLRAIAHTDPYMHNGIFNLRGLLNVYNAGSFKFKKVEGDPKSPVTSPILKELKLSDRELTALRVFLLTL